MKHPPVRRLPDRPDLNQLRRQAKELLAAYRAGEAAEVAQVGQFERGTDAANFALHHAQLVVARSYGFDSWPKLKARVDGVTISRLADAIRAADHVQVRALLKTRPELATMDMDANNEHQPLHYAVLTRSPEMVRLLMEHGANSRKGIWPIREATSPLTLAIERGYEEIVAIIHDAERRRRPAANEAAQPARTDNPQPAVHSAVKRGDLAWLRARSAEGPLVPENWVGGGQLLSLAVEHDQPEVLSFLLDLGFDPDERIRLGDLDDPVYTWGGALHRCAGSGKLTMAEILLAHGADSNAQVYASGSVMFKAYAHKDEAMVKLLEAYGGFLDAASVGFLGQTEMARRMLADESAGRLRDGIVSDGSTLAETLLWTGAGGGEPEIVQMALDRIDWPRNDPRWHWPLWQAFTSGAGDPQRGLGCFRILLQRADPNVSTFGRTILHDVVAAGKNVEERLPFAKMLLDAGARTDLRDDLLRSTPLGWACRWGRVEIAKLLLERGADPRESGAEPWATPRAWAEKMQHPALLALLGESDELLESR